LSELSALLALPIYGSDFHTIRGLVILRLKHAPAEDESIVAARYRFAVTQTTELSLVKLRREPA